MNRNRYIPVILLCIFPLLQTCEHSPRLNFDRIFLPGEPRNFDRKEQYYEKLNSAYDDYNSNIWYDGNHGDFRLAFSTNRESSGGDYDLIMYECNFYANPEENHFEINYWKNWDGMVFDYHANGEYGRCNLEDINSEYNELGPVSESSDRDDVTGPNYGYQYSGNERHWRFLWASDSTGDLDIYCHYLHISPTGDQIAGEKTLETINSAHNDAYPALYVAPDKKETLYFTSDRDGDFDLFSAAAPDGGLIDQATTVTIAKAASLSGDSDDKCPWISGNIMVFCSDRDGGYGGFDLYYSVFTENAWSEPVNFGNKINTEYNEYRPVLLVLNVEHFFSDLLVFSSDRPGGQGGYDLYYTGVGKKLFK